MKRILNYDTAIRLECRRLRPLFDQAPRATDRVCIHCIWGKLSNTACNMYAACPVMTAYIMLEIRIGRQQYMEVERKGGV